MQFSKRFAKISGLVLAVLIVGVCGTSSAMAEKPPKVEPQEQAQQELVKVSTLGSVEANQEFQRNVQVMQAQRQRVIQLQAQLEQTQTGDLKKSLKKELDAALAKLNADNKKMAETYGFSLNRNYLLVVEKAHIYMAVSPEEAAAISEGEKK